MTSGTYADVWVSVKTTCSCIIETATGTSPNPDGRPRHFVAIQTDGKITFSFHDYSGCEEGFQFYRNTSLLNSEFQARGQCFETLAPTHIGDSLAATDDEEKLVIPPGSTHTYCVKAIGGPVGADPGFYASGLTCTDLTIKWGATVSGMIRSQSDNTIGISGVLVSLYLLTQPEHDEGMVREWQFSASQGRRARSAGNATAVAASSTPLPGIQVQPAARSTQRSRRQATGQVCPAELAFDENSLPLHDYWPETGSGQTVSLSCPDLGLVVSELNRTCSYAGNWGEVEGECTPVLVQFTKPQPVFVRMENIPFADNRHLLYNTDPATCAWHCLTLNTACRSFEVFRGDTQPICFISSVHSNDTDVTFLPARFGSIHYYEMETPGLRETFEVLDQTLIDLYVPTYTDVCSIEALAAQGNWPYDPESSTRYMDQHQHLRQIEAARCSKVDGNLILRCDEGCDDKLRRALASFGAVMTLADEEVFCGAPESAGPWGNYSIERMGVRLTAICNAGVNMTHCRAAAAGGDTSALIRNTEYRVQELSALRFVEAVTGVVEISGCAHLERFDGGLARLNDVQGHSIGGIGPIRISDNAMVTGTIAEILPAIPRYVRNVGEIRSNPRLCGTEAEDMEGVFIYGSNADSASCGCTLDNAPNFDNAWYNSTETKYDDGSCDVVMCHVCFDGTNGRCTYTKANGDRICVPQTQDGRCPPMLNEANPAPCDLCEGVTCNSPPNCRASGSGVCQPATGLCTYPTLLAAGSRCSDGDPFTGPDVCSASGVCTTTKACSVAHLLSKDEPKLLSQDNLDTLAGCGTVDGPLHIECTLATSTSITNVSSLASIRRVTGYVAFDGCDSITSFGLENLMRVDGEFGLESYAMILTNNAGPIGTLNSLFPALSGVDGLVHVRDNAQICTTTFDWFDHAPSDIAGNAVGCGCTDPNAANYLAIATQDDGTCVKKPCNGGCIDSDLTDCLVPECDEATDRCNLVPASPNATDSCSDGLNYTIDDICVVDEASADGIICEGTNLCESSDQEAFCEVQVPRPGDSQCSFLDDCFEGICTWETEADGVACNFDSKDHTIDVCISGVCVPQFTDNCYQPSNYETGDPFERILEIHDNYQCSTTGTFTLGDVMTFEIFHPHVDNAAHAHHTFGITVLGVDVARDASHSITGHWEIEPLPGLDGMKRLCKKTCFEEQMEQHRAGVTSLTNATDDIKTSFVKMCGADTCQGGAFVESPDCAYDISDSAMCRRWQGTYGLCSTPNSGEMMVAHQFSLDGLTKIGSTTYTGVSTVEPAASTAPAEIIAVFQVHDSGGVGHIINFDVRPFDHFAHDTTDEAGEYAVGFAASVAGRQAELAQMVSATVFGSTTGIRHEFLSLDDRDKIVHHQSHLIMHNAEKKIDFINNSTHPITGIVHLASARQIVGNGVSSADRERGQLVDELTCYAVGARVCAFEIDNDREVACSLSRNDGVFTVSVLEGSSVYLKVTKDGRVFANASRVLDVIRIRDVVRVDIADITVAPLRLQYGGGSCMKPLGGASFTAVAQNGNPSCNLLSAIATSPTSVNTLIKLPSQAYDIELTAVSHEADVLTFGSSPSAVSSSVTNAGILAYFDGEDPGLLPVFEQAGRVRAMVPVDNAADAMNVAESMARWEFHIVPHLTLECAACELEHCYTDPENGEDSRMVMNTDQNYIIDVLLSQNFYVLDGNAVVCNAVPGSVTYAEAVSAEGGESKVAPTNVRLSADGSLVSHDPVRILLKAGPPNVVDPFTAEVRAAYTPYIQPHSGQGWHLVGVRTDIGRVRALVIMQGELNLNPGADDSFKVPEYVPLLILRRPPGASSFASMTTAHSASSAFAMERTKVGGLDGSGTQKKETRSLVGKQGTNGWICAGNGALLVGASVIKCTASDESENEILNFKYETDSTRASTHTDSGVVSFSINVEMKTADVPNLVGHTGDLFLSLAMSIKLRTLTIIRVSDTCRASRSEITKWLFDQHSADELSVDEATALKQVTKSSIVKNSQIPDELALKALIDDSERPMELPQVLKTTYLKNAYVGADNKWNTHTVYSLYDIMSTRLGQLEGLLADANSALNCLTAYDEDECPSADVVFRPDYGTVELHAMRAQVAKAGIKGWKNTLLLSKKLENKAIDSDGFAMTTQEIWSSDLTDSLSDTTDDIMHHTDLATPLTLMANAVLELDEAELTGLGDHFYDATLEELADKDSDIRDILMYVDIGMMAASFAKIGQKSQAKSLEKLSDSIGDASSYAAKKSQNAVKTAFKNAAPKMFKKAYNSLGKKVGHKGATKSAAAAKKKQADALKAAVKANNKGLEASAKNALKATADKLKDPPGLTKKIVAAAKKQGKKISDGYGQFKSGLQQFKSETTFGAIMKLAFKTVKHRSMQRVHARLPLAVCRSRLTACHRSTHSQSLSCILPKRHGGFACSPFVASANLCSFGCDVTLDGVCRSFWKGASPTKTVPQTSQVLRSWKRHAMFRPLRSTSQPMSTRLCSQNGSRSSWTTWSRALA